MNGLRLVAALSSAALVVALVFAMVSGFSRSARAAENEVPVVFSGGHETDPRDGGRPVVLVEAALGVKPEVFREAFSGVRPAHNGGPTPEEARRNKAALMKVLGPYGITNERLDEVSNYYRYQPQRGQLWKNTPAKAHAILENGKVKSVVVTDPGSGYSTPPKATVQGMDQVRLKVSIDFNTDMKKNGAIRSVEVEETSPSKRGGESTDDAKQKPAS